MVRPTWRLLRPSLRRITMRRPSCCSRRARRFRAGEHGGGANGSLDGGARKRERGLVLPATLRRVPGRVASCESTDQGVERAAVHGEASTGGGGAEAALEVQAGALPP